MSDNMQTQMSSPVNDPDSLTVYLCSLHPKDTHTTSEWVALGNLAQFDHDIDEVNEDLEDVNFLLGVTNQDPSTAFSTLDQAIDALQEVDRHQAANLLGSYFVE